MMKTLFMKVLNKGGLVFLEGSFPPSYLVATVEGGWGELDCSPNVTSSHPNSLNPSSEARAKRATVRRGVSKRTGPHWEADTKRPLSLRSCGPMTTMVAS